MNSLIEEYIKAEQERLERSRESTLRYLNWLGRTFGALSLSDSAQLNLSSEMPWVHVRNREDLQELMRLAPLWKKEPSKNAIKYVADIEGYNVSIFAQEGALPPTCRIVKKEVTIPAVPEHTEIVEEVVCHV